jgi:murein DD-endopeptidase MepM/ murein hydrolase activator NlpD
VSSPADGNLCASPDCGADALQRFPIAHDERMPRPAAVLLIAVVAATCAASIPSSGSAAEFHRPSDRAAEATAVGEWAWPVWPFRLVEPYEQPAHRYAPGHRGIDLEPLDRTDVRAPAAGVVAFAGRVADRELLTIDHGDGFITTLEPVLATVEAGTQVAPGDIVGEVDRGGHTVEGAVHFGVRLHGEYINPLALYGGVPRAVLLPCCD